MSFATAPAFAAFEQDLLKDVIPRSSRATRSRRTASTGPSPACRWAAASRSTSGWRTSTPSPGSAASPRRPTRSRPEELVPDPGDGQAEAEAALDRLRQQGRPDPHQPGRARLSEGEGRPARLARGLRRARPDGLEERPILLRPANIPMKTFQRIARSLPVLALSVSVAHAFPGTRPVASDHVVATVEATKTLAPISRYLYGQFLEHIGDLVNGGLWAEMLDDRKFFRPIVDKEPAKAPGPFGAAPPRRWTAIGPSTRFFVIRTSIR